MTTKVASAKDIGHGSYSWGASAKSKRTELIALHPHWGMGEIRRTAAEAELTARGKKLVWDGDGYVEVDQ